MKNGRSKSTKTKARSRGQKRAFTEQQIGMIESLLLEDKRVLAVRDLALLRVALDTMLRASDLLKLTVGDVIYGGEIKDEIMLKQKKTGKTVRCQILPKAQKALSKWLAIGDKTDLAERVFPMTIRQYSRVVKSFAEMLKLDPAGYSTHSLRRTKPSIIYAKTKNVAVVQRLLGHAGVQATSHYLGIGQAEAFDVAREFDL